mgnify:CR=1 FL=1
MLGNLFQNYLNKKNKSITVIGETSGDTGSAAIEAFKGKDNINVFILQRYLFLPSLESFCEFLDAFLTYF